MGRGGKITTNDATIILDGANSGTALIEDSNSNALSKLANNNGSFTIQNGGITFQTLTTSAFTNSNTVAAGSGTTFKVGPGAGTSPYTQTAGITNIGAGGGVGGTLVSPTVTIEGGLLEGSGTINGNVIVNSLHSAATIQAGDPPGTLDLTGTLDLSCSTLNQLLGGSVAGTGYGVVDVSGQMTISGSMISLEDLTSTNLETFDIVNANNANGWTRDEFSDNTIAFMGGTIHVSYGTPLTGTCAAGYQDCIDLTFHSSTTAAEPSSLLLLAIVLAALALAGPGARIVRSKA